MQTTEPISIRLRPDVDERIRRLAAAEANSVTGTLRRIIALGLKTIDEHDQKAGSPATTTPA
jgi:hypothetical protein